MKSSMKLGLTATREIVVDRGRSIDFMGDKARVYATPQMVNDVEWVCRDLILEHCDAGEDSVGTHVDIDHLAATPIGWTVRITIEVVEIEGRSISCVASVHDGLELVGRGRHTRFVVDIAKTEARLAAKTARAPRS